MRFTNRAPAPAMVDGQYPFLPADSEAGKHLTEQIARHQAVLANATPMVIEYVKNHPKGDDE